jgi:hypothetical protein
MNTRYRTAAAAAPVAAPAAAAPVAAAGQVMDMPVGQLCPCGGGQSCIVDRRWVGDWVHEDDVFTNAGLPLRKNCFTSFTTAQKKLLY